MRLSKTFFSSLREVPRDAETVSHQLMMRGNFIRKHGAGIYSYLPLLVRSIHKFQNILREEFAKISWNEVMMPFVIPSELWKESGRWQTMGHIMARLKDRKENEFCLGPTHEEVVTDLVRAQINSYKQLPLTLYQITGKFRDEIRPRFGLMRGREFIMMDGYSFHRDTKDLDRHYEEVAAAYDSVFTRAGLKFVRVEADSGAIGGSGSHEYHVLADSGEDAIMSCSESRYAANLEKAVTPPPERQKRDWGSPPSQAYEELATPTQKTIAEVSAMTGVPAHRNVKTLVYRYLLASDPKQKFPVVVYLAGHRQLNEVKLQNAVSKLKGDVLVLEPMPEGEVEKLFQCPVGFLGPIGGPKEALSFYDREVAAAHDVICGANRAGYHFSHCEPARDFPGFDAAKCLDLGLVEAGDLSPILGASERDVYEVHRGIEVGHIFKLGDKYSKAMNAVYQDDQKGSQVIQMGCYGIGVTRVLAAAIEQNHDAHGIKWPAALAPFQVHLICLAPEDGAISSVADAIYEGLQARGIEVLYDDRAEMSPGVKFKDADLIGIPHRFVVGKKGLEAGQIEYVSRLRGSKEMLPYAAQEILATIAKVLA